MSETSAAQTMRLRSLQDRWLAVNEYRWVTEGNNARIHGPASPTFNQLYYWIWPEWEEWLKKEIDRLGG